MASKHPTDGIWFQKASFKAARIEEDSLDGWPQLSPKPQSKPLIGLEAFDS
jgi:hypothetical protein